MKALWKKFIAWLMGQAGDWLEPHLTGSMMEFMAWVEKGIEAREPTEEGKEKVRQLLYETARARAFG